MSTAPRAESAVDVADREEPQQAIDLSHNSPPPRPPQTCTHTHDENGFSVIVPLHSHTDLDLYMHLMKLGSVSPISTGIPVYSGTGMPALYLKLGDTERESPKGISSSGAHCVITEQWGYYTQGAVY